MSKKVLVERDEAAAERLFSRPMDETGRLVDLIFQSEREGLDEDATLRRLTAAILKMDRAKRRR